MKFKVEVDIEAENIDEAISKIQERYNKREYKLETDLFSIHVIKLKDFKKEIEMINNKFFNGEMSDLWYEEINILFNDIFDVDVINALLEYCLNKQALQINYVEAVAGIWRHHNIKTIKDLEKYFKQQEKVNEVIKELQNKLKLSRQFTEYEKCYIEKWILDYEYDLDIIEIAVKEVDTKEYFECLDSIITAWKYKNLKTYDEIQNFINTKIGE